MRTREIVGSALALGSLVWAYRTWAAAPDVPTPEEIRAESGPAIPAIDLARLSDSRRDWKAPARDVFAYGRGAPDFETFPTSVIRLAPTPRDLIPLPAPDPTPTPWPLLNIVLTGIVDLPGGRRAASFVKDGDVVLVGPAGAVLANSFRVVSVGLSTAEVEELGSGRVRRLPLKTN